MDLSKAELATENINPGLEKYLVIMDCLHSTDVSEDVAFQKKFNGFYRMRQRKPEFYEEYFNYLESNKNLKVSFDEALTHFYNKFDRIEASFCSKLVATIDSDLPVWDTFVLQNLGLKKPPQYSRDRLNKTINLYSKIKEWYLNFMFTDEGKYLIDLFDRKYPSVNITNVKKIDLILWQMR